MEMFKLFLRELPEGILEGIKIFCTYLVGIVLLNHWSGIDLLSYEWYVLLAFTMVFIFSLSWLKDYFHSLTIEHNRYGWYVVFFNSGSDFTYIVGDGPNDVRKLFKEMGYDPDTITAIYKEI